MSKKSAALVAHRRRLKQRGIVRLEVRVRRDDAGLVGGVAAALADPARARRLRALLRRGLAPRARTDLKALLAEAPLDGVDLTRARDRGRRFDW